MNETIKFKGDKMPGELQVEKYRQYFEISRFDQEILNNLFKFYFMLVYSIFGFIGWICTTTLKEEYVKNPEAFRSVKCLLPIPIYESIYPWSSIVLVLFGFLLVYGFSLFLLIVVKKFKNSEMKEELKQELGITSYLPFAEYWLYIAICSLLNSAIILFFTNTLNILGFNIFWGYSNHFMYLLTIIISFLGQIIIYWMVNN